jgi:peptide/nickel transport system ATP-binding protein
VRRVEPLLSVEGLRTAYTVRRRDVNVLDGVDFKMERGKTFAIAGESGCGKTTLGLSIAQLLPDNALITGGKIVFDGRDILQMREDVIRKEIRWKRISMVFQGSMSAFNPVLRVGDQIIEAILMHEKVPRSEARERTLQLFASVGISDKRISAYPHELSGGMRQRAMIAMALASSPDLVIADEPTTGLDVLVQAQIIQLLKKLRKELGRSLIFISHDLSVVAQVADECAIMYAGRMVELGTVTQIFRNPLHPYTMKLLRAFPDVREENRIRLIGIPGEPPSLTSPPNGCRFNPRCEHAMDVCRREDPKLTEFESGHYVSCYWAAQKLGGE